MANGKNKIVLTICRNKMWGHLSPKNRGSKSYKLVVLVVDFYET